MATNGPVRKMIRERREQREKAVKKLMDLAKSKINLKRPVFFVPGWTDEDNSCWKTAYKKDRFSIKDWLDRICINPHEARYVNFEGESRHCNSFLDFGEVLKEKIWKDIGKDKVFDIVGHSMGGLNIRAAVTQGEPLLNIHSCITVATPHQGDHLGGINVWTRNNPLGRLLIGWMLKKDTPYHREQSKGLDPDYEPIKTINRPENRRGFLERMGKLYEFIGTRDFTVKGSAYMNRSDINSELCNSKMEDIIIGGANHTGKIGITQDPSPLIS